MSRAKKPKKNGPWVPGKSPLPAKVAQDLGLPQERLTHGDFEIEQIATGHHRLREKSMLTHWSLLAERANSKLRAYADQGKEPDQDIVINQTPADRATATWRRLLWRFLETHYRVIEGKSGKTNYEKSSHSSELNRLPMADKEFKDREFYHWVKKQPGGRELTEFLADVAAQCNPQACPHDHRVMSHVEIGAWLLDADSPRECKAAATGALSLACRILAGMSAGFAAQERHEKYRKQN